MLSLLLAASLIASKPAAGYTIKLHDMKDFIQFAETVNSGMMYNGVTLDLESDLDFSDPIAQGFEPIGLTKNNYFPGTFDGKGHVISNLNINSDTQYVGLFGYGSGTVIKNVIIDSSCSITSTRNDTINDVYVGGFVGKCGSTTRSCIIENSVNMADITFSSPANMNLVYVGGIVGAISPHFTLSGRVILNTANYGTISVSADGTAMGVGGIVGTAYEYLVGIANSINYGTITIPKGNISVMTVGGIVGYAENLYLLNSVSIGTITMGISANNSFIGAIAGFCDELDVDYSYWSKDIQYPVVGEVSSFESNNISSFGSDLVLNTSVSVYEYEGDQLVEALNAIPNHFKYDFISNWILNTDKDTISFFKNGDKIMSSDSKVILLPSFLNGEKEWFDGWYINEECTIPFTDFTNYSCTELYSMYGVLNKNFTITFDTMGGDPVDPIVAPYASVVELPRNLTRGENKLLYWMTESGEEVPYTFTVPSHNITLYAMWSVISIYTVEEFNEFANSVTEGKSNYSGVTVLLENDLDFSGSDVFTPIGTQESIRRNCFFTGVFDGQGHVISNITIKLVSTYVGLFGYVDGATIKNFVMDRSSSIYDPPSLTIYDYTYVGGIVGYCSSESGPCKVENVVNMMDVIYTRSIHNLYLGGIVGAVSSENGPYIAMDNCVNYGVVKFVHDCKDSNIYIGGLVGGVDYVRSNGIILQNSINYGDVTRSGKVKKCDRMVGGIIGDHTCWDELINCTNTGKVSSASTLKIWGVLGILFLMAFI